FLMGQIEKLHPGRAFQFVLERDKPAVDDCPNHGSLGVTVVHGPSELGDSAAPADRNVFRDGGRVDFRVRPDQRDGNCCLLQLQLLLKWPRPSPAGPTGVLSTILPHFGRTCVKSPTADPSRGRVAPGNGYTVRDVHICVCATVNAGLRLRVSNVWVSDASGGPNACVCWITKAYAGC